MSGGYLWLKRREMMKLLLSSVLLASLCDISSWSVLTTDAIVVTQTSDLSVTEGETVNITCCCTLKDSDQIRFSWKKNQTQLENNTVTVKSRYPFCANLTLSNITREDSGTYICKVYAEIPILADYYGNGTVVTVKSTGSSDEPTSDKNIAGLSTHTMIIIAAAVGILLLLITALCCFCSLRLRKAQAAMVIYEVPHFDSEEAETDKRNTGSSTGSTQWCQVPVYESFDYFEHVQNKESG